MAQITSNGLQLEAILCSWIEKIEIVRRKLQPDSFAELGRVARRKPGNLATFDTASGRG
jgi:hypothetical protein